MNEKFHKLRQEQQQETEHREIQSQQTEQFSSVEEMLRSDVAQTKVPPRVARRLNESIRRETPAETTWWKRLFGSK